LADPLPETIDIQLMLSKHAANVKDVLQPEILVHIITEIPCIAIINVDPGRQKHTVGAILGAAKEQKEIGGLAVEYLHILEGGIHHVQMILFVNGNPFGPYE
jgi:hypothetical protein